MARDISNSDDIIDSRDVISRIEELERDRDNAMDLEDVHADDQWSGGTNTYDARVWSEDENDELKSLKALAEEASGSPDWPYGEALIRDSYFEDYARELADDIGAIKSDAGWPNSFIDWERAADALKQDYFSVDFDGVEYWIRS
jgi:hypothetical protein